MRQSVHPMNTNGDGMTRRKLGMDDDSWQDLAAEESVKSAQSTTTHNRGPSFRLDPTIAPDCMPQPRPPLVAKNGGLETNESSDANNSEVEDKDTAEVLPPGGKTDGRSAVKSGRRLTFADETGGMLVEINYSTRTHYSKQTGPGAVQGISNGSCCVIQ